MANSYAHRIQYAQMIQAMKRVLKASLDKLVIGILYDEDWNPLILNNRLCFSFQSIPDMELRTRAANSWIDYRNKFSAEFHQKWTLQGCQNPVVESILMSLREELKGPKWDMKVNKFISSSTEKRFRLISDGKLEEAEALNIALRKTVAQITDYRLGDANAGFDLTPATQRPQPKESKTEDQIGEEVFTYAGKSTLRTDYGLGGGNVGFESTTITQEPQPKESKTEGQIGEEVFAYAKKSKPRTDNGLGGGNFGFGSTQIMQVPQPKESKNEGQIGEEILANAKKSTPGTNYDLDDGGVRFGSTQITQVSQRKECKAEVQIGEEVFAYAKKPTSRTDSGLGDEDVEFASIPIMQVPHPKKSKTDGQIGEEIFTYTRKSTPRKRTDKVFDDETTPRPARKARRTKSTLPAESNHYGGGTSSEPSGELDPQVVFVYTRKQPAASRTKREPVTIIPSNTSSHITAVMAEPNKETTEPLESAAQMAI